MATPVAVSTIEEEGDVSLISWGAVIAGGLAAAALTLLLLAFGAGIGLSVVSPWANEGVSATTFQVGTGAYLIVVAMLASTVGGLIAGRMRARWIRAHRDEVFFRDTAHGFLAWAFATVLGAAALGAATTSILSSASAGSIPATAAAGAQAGQSPIIEGYVDQLFRAPAGASPATQQSAADMQAIRAEAGRIFTSGLRRGADLSAADRSYLAQVVSARTGMPQAEAEKRVNAVVTQAKQATDEARKAAAEFPVARGINARGCVRCESGSDRRRRVPRRTLVRAGLEAHGVDLNEIRNRGGNDAGHLVAVGRPAQPDHSADDTALN